ncbi:putative TIM-barrel fold metal-dependent hydrolase [Saccharomonospora azurea NA-128]|uniref:TIM-barrel fold metal-dependent hydrolase n=2 Tax=Saccharomonospora azurea TaxID=40988 RepID=H8G469_9PSEU|nr:putative TIM-barrel fold metal-dependent hydrolase [Saccharomonospora azurea NA-128]
MSTRHTGRVFDFHARLPPRPGAARTLLATMDRHGIGRAVVCAGGTVKPDTLSRWLIDGGHTETGADNDAVLAACEGEGDRLVPFYFANPHEPLARYLDRASGFRGVEVSPAVHGVALTDTRVRSIADAAGEYGHPFYTVCLSRPGCGVTEFAALAREFPNTTFVLGHLGIGNIDFHAVNLVRDLANVVVETSGGYSSVAAAAVERLGADRVLFAGEYPLQDHAVELAKIAALELSDVDAERVLYGNALRILGEEGERAR